MIENFYGLDADNNVIEFSGRSEWREFMLNYKRRTVSKTLVGGVEVSTMFIGVDKSLGLVKGSPLCFETHIFGGPYDGEEWRYTNWVEAQKDHDLIVHCLTEGGDISNIDGIDDR